MVYLRAKLLSKNLLYAKTLLIVGMFLVLGVLEYSTPSEYVFGYLYSGAILLVNSWFGEMATLQATLAAVFLTMLNLWMP